MRTVNFISHNELTLLCCGGEFLPALAAAINGAQHEIYLETYIFAADASAGLIKEALIRAAARGVRVHIITDWHGTGRTQVNLLSREFLPTGVRHRVFNPWFWRGATRSHRKICVVDRKQAFVGGLNLNDDFHCDFDYHVILPAPRWDFAVQIRGPLVATIHREAQLQWARLGKIDVRRYYALFREMRAPQLVTTEKAGLAGFVVRDNLRNRRTIQRAYLQALGGARKSVFMANPYFAPGHKFIRALALAATRGVEVTLLIGAGQFRLQDAIARAFYPKLLKSGVKLFEYRKTQLHGKVAVIDDEWATVGSSNCDGLSLFLNHEANVVTKEAVFAQNLRAQIEAAVEESLPVQLKDFANIPWHKRAGYELAYLLYRGMMQVITWGEYN